jgi:hypothetical protein
VCLRPFAFVAVHVAADLRRPGAERTHVCGELPYFSGAVEGVSVRGQRVPELRVGDHRGMPDPVDRRQRVPHAHGVQPAPSPGGEHPGVDLQVQVPVRIPGAGGVVVHRHRLQHLDRYLHLPTARPHPGGGVLCQPTR